jgi:Cu2+-containing amine oxidase
MPDHVTHPLEPLSAREIEHAVSLLRTQGKVSPTTRFVSVSLMEPAKELVHAGESVAAMERKAFVVLFDNATNSCFEAELSLTNDVLLAWRHIPGVQPTMTIDEQIECEQAVFASAESKPHCSGTTARTTRVSSWLISGALATTVRKKTTPADWRDLSVFCAAN